MALILVGIKTLDNNDNGNASCLDEIITKYIKCTVNREILVMVLFWPILAPKYEVPKLNTPKYVTLQKLTAKIEHCLYIFLYLYSLICTFLSYFFPK